MYHYSFCIMTENKSQRERAYELFQELGIVRLREFLENGITAATVSRMVRNDEVMHLDRGIYQLTDASLETHHSFAEVAKRAPNGVVCLVSALTYHEMTDQLPTWTWIAIGYKDWKPRTGNPPIRVIRFADKYLNDDVIVEHIEGVPVKIFGVAKTVADCFRHRNKIGYDIAIESLQQALRQRKATPAEIADHAIKRGVFNVMRPYVEALIANR